MHVLEINGQPFVVGLLWSTADGPASTRALKRWAQVRAQQLNSASAASAVDELDSYVIRRQRGSGLVQIGLAASQGERGKHGHPSLLCMVLESPDAPKTWCGRFRFAQGWWIVCVLKEQILFRLGDAWCSGEREAVALWQELQADQVEWDLVVDCESEKDSLEHLFPWLGRNAAGATLRPLHGLNFSKALRLAVAVGTGLVLGGLFLFHNWQEEQTALQRMQLEAELRRQAQGQAVDIDKVFPPTWRSFTDPVAVFQACRGALAGIPQNRLGWELAEASCSTGSGGSVSAKWKRGSAASFLLLPDGASISPGDGQHVAATFAAPVAASPTASPATTLPKLPDVAAVLMETNRILDGALTVDWKPIETREVAGAKISAPWRVGAWVLKLPFSPTEAVSRLAEFPGVALRKISIKWSESDPSPAWILEGESYVQAQK